MTELIALLVGLAIGAVLPLMVWDGNRHARDAALEAAEEARAAEMRAWSQLRAMKGSES